MSKMIQPGKPEKRARDKIKSNKKNARIGFLESMGDSGYDVDRRLMLRMTRYDNRTDPNYCFDVLQNFMKGEEPEKEEGLG